jgi:hypothetical protein
MKRLFESSETFSAHATIDGCYFAIDQIYKELKQINPKTIIMTDDICRSLIRFVNCIIKNKKKIDADYSGDKEFLIEFKKVIKERKRP